MAADLFQVRLWDGFDGEWCDVGEPTTKEAAEQDAGDRNFKRHGRRDGNYNDIDYYAVFPTASRMQFAEGRSQTKGR